MKIFAGLILFSLLACAAAPLHAQSDGTIDLGASADATLTVGDGSLTISDGASTVTAGTVTITDAATLSLVAAGDGSVMLNGGVLTGATYNSILAYQPGIVTPLNLTVSDLGVLATTGIINPLTGAGTAIITGGALTLNTNLAVTTGANGLTLNGVLVGNTVFSRAPQQLIFPFNGTLVYTPVVGQTTPQFTAASLQTSVNAGLNFNLIPALTNFGGLGTTVRILDGTASVNRTVLTTFSAGPAGAASDDVNFGGTIADTYVLELSYSQAAALAMVGGPDAMRLDWLDPSTGQWENAVEGNTGGTPLFVDDAYDPTVDFNLGTYGVDTTNQVVWAVVDHNSQFVADGQMAPEPGSLMLLSWGLAGVLGVRRFRRGS